MLWCGTNPSGSSFHLLKFFDIAEICYSEFLIDKFKRRKFLRISLDLHRIFLPIFQALL